MENPQELRERVQRYRRLATTTTDERAIAALCDLADKYESIAAALEKADQRAPQAKT